MCGGKGGGSTQTATTTSSPPASVLNAYNNISSLAEQAASAPLQQYSGPLLAGFTDAQNQAFTNIGNAQNTLQPYLNSASNLVNQGTQNIYSQLPQYNAQNIAQYQNPYQQQVINATMAQANQQDQQQQQQLTGNAIASGAWGGDRAAVAQGVLGGQQAMANNSTLAGLNSQGFQNAQSEFNTQQQTQLSALQNQAGLALQGAGVEGYLGNTGLNGQLSAAGAQLQAGNQQQAQAQNALNIPYEQFLQQQAYPFQTTDFLAQTLLNTAGSQGGTSSTTQPSQTGNTAAQIAGLGLGVAGLFANKGGRINQYDSGGGVPDVDVNFIPLSGGLSANGSGIPRPPSIPQQQSGGMGNLAPIASGLGALKGVFAGNGVPTDTGENSVGGAESDTDMFSDVGMMPDDMNRGGIIKRADGGMPYYASGGTAAPSGGATVNKATTPNAPTTSYINLGGATGNVPVYSFASPGGTSNNNGYSSTIPNTLNYSGLKDFSLSSLATPNGSPAATTNSSQISGTNPLTQTQFNALLAKSPGYSTEMQMQMAADPGGYNTDLARGGKIPHYDIGGSSPASAFAPLSANYGAENGMPGGSMNPMMQMMFMNQLNGNNNQQQNLAGNQPLPAFGMPTATNNVAALNSAMPLAGVLGNGQSGGASGIGIPQAPSGGLSGLPDAPDISSASPAASDDSDTGTSNLDLSKVDPGLALSEAGFAMAASPSRKFLQAVGQGAQAGLKNYQEQKAQQVSADEKAEQLATMAEKFGTGNWTPIQYQDGTTGLLNTKTGETKQTDQNFTPVGKTGASKVLKDGDTLVDSNGNVLSGTTPAAGSNPATPTSANSAPPAAPTAADPNLHGDAFLKTLDPAQATQVKLFAEGKLPQVSGFALSKPYWQNMLSNAVQYDPTFDAVNPGARAKVRNDFTSGKDAQNINALNTAIGHVGDLQTAADALNNGNIRLFNAIGNKYNVYTGADQVTNYNNVLGKVSEELTKAYRGSGGNESDIQREIANLPASSSPDQFKGGLTTIATLLKSKIDALNDQYQRGMGTAANDKSFYTPTAVKTLKGLGVDIDKGIPKISSPGDYQNLQSGSTYYDPNGNLRTKP
jgi:hypothetical protein